MQKLSATIASVVQQPATNTSTTIPTAQCDDEGRLIYSINKTKLDGDNIQVILAEGRFLTGNFKNGLLIQGRFISKTLLNGEQTWKVEVIRGGDSQVSRVILKELNGNNRVYEGLVDGQLRKSGIGTMKLRSGNSFVGEYLEDKSLKGKWIFYNNSGEEFSHKLVFSRVENGQGVKGQECTYEIPFAHGLYLRVTGNFTGTKPEITYPWRQESVTPPPIEKIRKFEFMSTINQNPIFCITSASFEKSIVTDEHPDPTNCEETGHEGNTLRWAILGDNDTWEMIADSIAKPENKFTIFQYAVYVRSQGVLSIRRNEENFDVFFEGREIEKSVSSTFLLEQLLNDEFLKVYLTFHKKYKMIEKPFGSMVAGLSLTNGGKTYLVGRCIVFDGGVRRIVTYGIDGSEVILPSGPPYLIRPNHELRRYPSIPKDYLPQISSTAPDINPFMRITNDLLYLVVVDRFRVVIGGKEAVDKFANSPSESIGNYISNFMNALKYMLDLKFASPSPTFKEVMQCWHELKTPCSSPLVVVGHKYDKYHAHIARNPISMCMYFITGLYNHIFESLIPGNMTLEEKACTAFNANMFGTQIIDKHLLKVLVNKYCSVDCILDKTTIFRTPLLAFTICSIYPDKDEIERIYKEYANLLERQISDANRMLDVNEKFRSISAAIIFFVARLEVSHFFYNGNNRLFCQILLYKLLYNNEMDPSIIFFPNGFSHYVIRSISEYMIINQLAEIPDIHGLTLALSDALEWLEEGKAFFRQLVTDKNLLRNR